MSGRKLRAHVFVCTNEREEGHPRGCCLAKNSEEIVRAFKEEVKKAGLKPEIRAQRSGCLDTCEDGPSVVVYPEGVWYAKVTPADVPEIVQSHLVDGIVVDRLKMIGK